MKKYFLFLLLSSLSLYVMGQYTNRELILNTTGSGFQVKDGNGVESPNGISVEKWENIQKFANLTYNGQDASITAVRLYVDWTQYEPTPGNYVGRAKIVQAVQAITGLKSGTMKIALNFPYMRPGPLTGNPPDTYFGDIDKAKTSDGTLVQSNIAFSNPSIYSPTGKQRFYAFVNDVMNQLSTNNLMSNLLYFQMGNGQAEEFAMPYLNATNPIRQGMYEDHALTAWRTQYLPCRYPGQTSVTWDGNTYAIASAPPATNPYGDWNSEHQREYHRFASWGLMNFYKGFRDVIKSYGSSLKVLYYISDFGTGQGNLFFMHNASIPMGLNEFDGIYTTDGTYVGDLWKKIKSIDAIKGTNPNKIAGMEFDQEDLGQTSSNPTIDVNLATEWIGRAYKHGVNYVHLAMWFNDTEIEQLKPVFANVRSTYLTSGYTPPPRQSPITQNLFPTVFTGTELFSSWASSGGENWASTDNNPVSINMTDDEYWQNIWSCSNAPTPCDFIPSASNSTEGPNLNLTYSCAGDNCNSGETYAWSGNGISGSGTPKTITAPTTPGTYTYTVTASKTGCSNKTASTTFTVPSNPGGSSTNCVSMGGSCSGNSNEIYNYTLPISSDGTYPIRVNYKAHEKPSIIRMKIDQGSWQNYNVSQTGVGQFVNVILGNFTLAEGDHSFSFASGDGYICFGELCAIVEGCTTPSAPSVSANPSTISSGQTATLTATGCSGTVTWSNGATGTTTSVSPTTTTSYTATCSVGTCTSAASSSATVTVSPPPGNTNCNALEGFFDDADCTTLKGWVFDYSSPNAVVNVDIYEGATLIQGNVPANIFRQDLMDAGKGNGAHGFEINTPSALKNSQSHTLTMKVTGCSYSLNNSPKTISGCTGGSSSYSQCLEAETSTGNGSVSSDPNASNGQTRGSENNYDHYVDYALTSVPSAGIYYVTLQYYSTTAPTVSVSVNSGTPQTINLANSGSWNIVHTTYTFAVSLASGNNTVRIQGAGGGSCRQDRICASDMNGSTSMLSAINPPEESTNKHGFSVMPNPNKGIFETRFFLERGKKGTLTVSDLQGRVLYRKTITGNGWQTERIKLVNKASGMVFLQLDTNKGRQEVKKINIIK